MEHSEGDIRSTRDTASRTLWFYSWEKPMQSEEQHLENQLKLVGKRPEDIQHVILRTCTFAPTRATTASSRTPRSTCRRRRCGTPMCAFEAIGYSRETFDVPGLHYEFLTGDREVLFEGISLVTARATPPAFRYPCWTARSWARYSSTAT